jgi:hypothetical protein
MQLALENLAHHLQSPAMPVGRASEPSMPGVADALCDKLMDHIFDCDACLSGQEDTCPSYQLLQSQIAAAGGPSQGLLLAV